MLLGFTIGCLTFRKYSLEEATSISFSQPINSTDFNDITTYSTNCHECLIYTSGPREKVEIVVIVNLKRALNFQGIGDIDIKKGHPVDGPSNFLSELMSYAATIPS